MLARDAARKVRTRRLDQEIERLKEALKNDPGGDETWGRLAWAHLARKDVKAAEACARAALRIRPYNARHMLVLALCRLAQGQTEGSGTLLAHATQASAVPFNHITSRDLALVFRAVRDTAARRALTAEYRAALKTDTFRAAKPRAEVLAEAGRAGRVLWTRREPLNKLRLWIVMEQRFLQVYDEEARAFEHHAERVRDFGVDDATVTSLAFTPSHVLAVANGRLLALDRAAGRWSAAQAPGIGAKAVSVSCAGAGAARVVFRGADGGGKTFVWQPAENKWNPDEGRGRPQEKLNADADAARFAAARYGDPKMLDDRTAAAALSQWQDLKTYVEACAPKSQRKDLLDARGRLDPATLRRIGAACGAPEGSARDYFRGITLPAWSRDTLVHPASFAALREMSRIGAEWVSITPTGYQDNPHSVEVAPDPEKTASLESVERFVKQAHALGLKVLLKPHVNLQIEEKDNHMWRGLILPRTKDDVAAWFKSYEAFLAPYADLAIRRKIEMMTVGVELGKMVSFTDHWRRLIRAVRDRGYKGKLTYAALHEHYMRVRFWNALDFIGIDAYFPATRSPRADLRQIVAGYNRLAARLARYAERVGKPVVFTEVGFNNLDGTNVKPWYWSGNPARMDNLEQAACYHAVFEVLPRQRWFAGMFWWSWEPGGAPMPGDPSYSPQSKLAELILEAYYRRAQP